MGSAFQRIAGLSFPVAVRGDDAYTWDADGRKYLDGCGGAGIACLGYSEQRIIRAIQEQASKLPYTHQMFFTNEPAELLAENLVSDAPEGLTRVFFGCGGSEQIDGTLKLARQYFVDKGEPERTRFIARQHSFHGNSLGALSVGGHRARREPYLPLLAESHHIANCYDYRGRLEGETDTAYALRCAQELEAKILELGEETVIAFIAETVGGATAGCLTSPPGYFRLIRDICNKYGVLLILDEIMCGLGRTGVRFACIDEGITPDLLVMAKGLAAGYQPISATLVSEKIYQKVMTKRGYFQHGHSYQAHPIACAAALAAQNVIRDDDLIANVREQGRLLGDLLVKQFSDHPHVGDIRGRGLFWAIEIVADRHSKEPFDPAKLLWLKILRVAMEQGLMCYPGGGCSDGKRGDHVLLAPPFNITDCQVHEIVEQLAVSLDAAITAPSIRL